uniref:ABC transporter domain-containing protein n=2 Tax=Triticum urartu TaxID=4572 RepID=A0A8R7VBZ5_TRIUA
MEGAQRLRPGRTAPRRQGLQRLPPPPPPPPPPAAPPRPRPPPSRGPPRPRPAPDSGSARWPTSRSSGRRSASPSGTDGAASSGAPTATPPPAPAPAASSASPSPSPSLPGPSASASGSGFRERKVADVALVWKALSVSVRDGRRRVVRGSNGYPPPRPRPRRQQRLPVPVPLPPGALRVRVRLRIPGAQGGRRRARLEGAQRLRPGRTAPRRQGLQRLPPPPPPPPPPAAPPRPRPPPSRGPPRPRPAPDSGSARWPTSRSSGRRSASPSGTDGAASSGAPTATPPPAPAPAASSASPSPSPSLPGPSASASGSGFRERKVADVALVWKALSVSVRDGRRRVVRGSTGYALPGTLTVVMGPARSGKSTLLRAIAGRLRGAERMYGEVFVNGVKSPLPYGSYGYADRDDVLIESLTVREMLYYSALLQLPGVFSSKKSFVEDAIAAMSLGDYADKLIGGHCFTKRLLTGERRRVSIARELVMRPHVLFIDEPLYHLDSVSALLLMVTLKKLASIGCTVIFTMYQSSTEVFGLFDRICLLSNGNTLFFGETLACLQ